jgi:hypothetical protein
MLPNLGDDMKFTEANVKSFKAPAGKADHIEFDDTMPGFGLRVRGGERKTLKNPTPIAEKRLESAFGSVPSSTLEKKTAPAGGEAEAVLGD